MKKKWLDFEKKIHFSIVFKQNVLKKRHQIRKDIWLTYAHFQNDLT